MSRIVLATSGPSAAAVRVWLLAPFSGLDAFCCCVTAVISDQYTLASCFVLVTMCQATKHTTRAADPTAPCRTMVVHVCLWMEARAVTPISLCQSNYRVHDLGLWFIRFRTLLWSPLEPSFQEQYQRVEDEVSVRGLACGVVCKREGSSDFTVVRSVTADECEASSVRVATAE